jgi:hypothetical protein
MAGIRRARTSITRGAARVLSARAKGRHLEHDAGETVGVIEDCFDAHDGAERRTEHSSALDAEMVEARHEVPDELRDRVARRVGGTRGGTVAAKIEQHGAEPRAQRASDRLHHLVREKQPVQENHRSILRSP